MGNVGGYGGTMGKNKEVALDLVEHAHELRNAGIEPFVLLRAGKRERIQSNDKP
jgi:hypothetical protein